MDIETETRLFRQADRLTGIELDELGADSFEGTDPDARGLALRQATLLAGCLWHASVILVDQLIEDIGTLGLANARGEDPDIASTFVLSGMPRRFESKYTPLFAQKLLVAAVDLTSRLTRGWEAPACVSQELLLRSLLDSVLVCQETYDVPLAEDWRSLLEEMMYEDLDHQYLYAPSADGFENDPDPDLGMTPMTFDTWFVPFDHDRHLPPYAEDPDPSVD